MTATISEITRELTITKEKLADTEARLEKVKETVRELLEQMKEQA